MPGACISALEILVLESPEAGTGLGKESRGKEWEVLLRRQPEANPGNCEPLVGLSGAFPEKCQRVLVLGKEEAGRKIWYGIAELLATRGQQYLTS